MTLPASGGISIGQVATELGISLPLALGDSRVLSLAGKSALPISLGDLYGKSAQAAIAASAVGSSNQYDSSNSGGTASVSASVNASGGAGGNSYAWNVVSNTGGAVVNNASLSTSAFQATKAFNKLATGSITVTVNCKVTDSQGNTTTTANVDATASWDSNR